MNDARQLMHDYLNLDAAGAANLFEEDGFLELPYLASLGIPPRYTGPAEISKFLTFLHDKMYPGFSFKDVAIHIVNGEQAFANYVIEASSGISGRAVHQEFFGHLVADGGKIKSLREAVDVLVVADAMFEGGIDEFVHRH